MVNSKSLANLKPPFPEGNGAAESHGAQVAAWKLEPRALELADGLRPLVPGFEAGDEVLLRTLCVVMARVEKAHAWLEAQESMFAPGRKGEVLGVVRLCSGWESQILKLCSALGLSPAARARLGADRGVAGATSALADHIARTYGEAS